MIEKPYRPGSDQTIDIHDLVSTCNGYDDYRLPVAALDQSLDLIGK
ncbi:MAG: hypothetical protein HKM93_23355 [Desulfobacteraceae bacterium]|nr:hypothetical protein [Desulfobacteraceae bacterium]